MSKITPEICFSLNPIITSRQDLDDRKKSIIAFKKYYQYNFELRTHRPRKRGKINQRKGIP